MPRDGSNIYSQPFPDVAEGTTIESPVFNGYVSDVSADLNAARPIVAGGTGATSASAARLALGAEAAKQGPVTNFSSFPFTNGSFYADASATGAPTANRFAGNYYGNSDDNYAYIDARDLTTGIMYVKRKIAGVWDASWSQEAGSIADADARYVNVTSDTMSGTLTAGVVNINGTYADHGFYKPSGGTQNWLIRGGDPTTGNFEIHRYALADGAYLGSPFSIARTTGDATFTYQLNAAGLGISGAATVTGNITGARIMASAGTYTSGGEVQVSNADGFRHIGGNISTIIRNDGSDSYMLLTNAGNPLGTWNTLRPFTVTLATGNVSMGHNVTVGGILTTSGSIYTSGHFVSSAAAVILAGAGNVYLRPNGVGSGVGEASVNSGGVLTTNGGITSTSGNLTMNGNITAKGESGWAYYVSGATNTLNAMTGTPGGGSGQMSILFQHVPGTWYGHNIHIWGGAEFQLRHDYSACKTGGATTWVILSDERIKTVKEEYTTGLDAIAALRPVRYTLNGRGAISPPSAEAKPATPDPHGYTEKVAAQEYVGLVAQEAETALPDCFKVGQGYIDGKEVDDMRSAEYTPLIFALVNAVKELKAKVEALEARR